MLKLRYDQLFLSELLFEALDELILVFALYDKLLDLGV